MSCERFYLRQEHQRIHGNLTKIWKSLSETAVGLGDRFGSRLAPSPGWTACGGRAEGRSVE